MDAIDGFRIIELGVDNAAAGLVLSTEALWNQTELDWRFFLANGSVFGICVDSELTATAALLPYSNQNAWISMVLVAAKWRRRGFATRLLDVCLKRAKEHGLTCWLDATPAGAQVYGPLGFFPTARLQRLRLSQNRRIRQQSPLSNASICTLNTRDMRAMGFGRSALLTEIGRRPGSRIVSSGESIALVRDGRTARHIGPVYAKDERSALLLVDEIAYSEDGPIVIDAIASGEAFLSGLIDAGWKFERTFQRMRFGTPRLANDEIPFAVIGPEFG
jgi:GNAT superfamily N-acetyltransferase